MALGQLPLSYPKNRNHWPSADANGFAAMSDLRVTVRVGLIASDRSVHSRWPYLDVKRKNIQHFELMPLVLKDDSRRHVFAWKAACPVSYF